MKRLYVSLVSILLAVIMTLAVFTSCGNTTPTDTTTPVAQTSGEGDTSAEETTTILDTGIFKDQDLGIYSWVDTNLPEYVDPDEASNQIEDAIVRRLVRTENRLGLETTWKLEKGNGSNKGFVENVIAAANTSTDFDVVCCYSSWAAVFTTRGVFRNLREYDDVMNFSAECWPQMMVNDCTINGKLYFCTGDVSNNLIYMSSLVFFNKDLVETYKLNDKCNELWNEKNLYELVKSGKWTNEALISLCQDIYMDLDGSNDFSDGDLYGFGTYSTLVDNFYYGAGMKTIVATKDGLAMADDLNNADKIADILQKANDFIHGSGFARFFNGHQPTRTSFSNGLTVFSLAPASHAYGTHSKAEGLTYGVLPVPKYDTEQDRYYSIHSMPYSEFGILDSSKKDRAAAAFLQAFGEQSFIETRPVFFEETMKAKYSESLDDAKMWDIIIGSQTFDLGRIFCESYNQITVDLFRTQITKKLNSVSQMQSQYKAIKKDTKALNDLFEKLQ